MNIEAITAHYFSCALWSSVDDNNNPLDDNYDSSDIAPALKAESISDLSDFIDSAGNLLSGLTDESIGHDFWLTRCGHGAGFWDRGLGITGDKLSEMAKIYGSVDLYIGADNLVYG